MSKRPAPRRPLLVEELEPRILYSADAATLLGAGLWTPGSEVRVLDAGSPGTSSPEVAVAATQQSSREIVFIDSHVPDATTLVDELMRQRGDGRAFDIVTLNADEDGIAQINRVLAHEQDLAAIHIISHGSDGALDIGTTHLDAARLAVDADAVARWGRALSAGGDLLLYGCDVANDASGQTFVQNLARVTGADVAASTDATGSTNLGGNWSLEYLAGRIEIPVAASATAQEGWTGLLAAPVAVNDAYAVNEDSTLLVAPSASNLSHWWNFNEGGSSQAVVDSGSLANDGTLGSTAGVDAVDPTWTTGYVGGTGLSFDGAGDFVATSSTELKSAGSFTLSAWFQTNATTGAHHILWQGYPGGNGYGSGGSTTSATSEMSLSIGSWNASYDNRIVFSLGYDVPDNGADSIFIASASPFTDTSGWHHVAVTVSDLGGGVMSASLYVDGNFEGTDTGSQNDRSIWDPLRIGAPGDGSRSFNGRIDEVRVYQTPLSAGQVQALARAGVLQNDTDADLGTLSAALVTGPAHAGAFTLNPDGSFSYTPNANFAGTDTFTYRANDGTVDSNVATVTIDVTPINDAPALDNARSPVLGAIGQNAGAPSGAVGTLVSSLVDFAVPAGQVDNISDPDAGAQLGLAVTAADTTNGSWWYSTDNGANWVALSAVSDASARLLAADAGTRLYFRPSPGYSGTLASAITFRAWDGTSGSNGGTADTSGANSGGATAFSTTTDIASLVVNAVNAAPVVTATGTTLAYTENAAATVIDPGLTLSDADSLNLTSATVALSANYVNGQDVLAFTNQLGITGSWNAGTGTLTLTGTTTLANYEAALRTVTYVNTSDTPSTATRTVSFVANDGTANSVPATRNLSVAAGNDAPTVVDNALSFDGTDLVVVSPQPNLVMTSTVTMEAMVQRTGVLSGTEIIVNKEGEYEMGVSAAGKLQWAFANATPGWTWVETSYTLPADTWVHVAVTYSGGVVKTYANGTLVDTFNGTGSIGDVYPAWNDLTIGGRQNAGTQRFDGLIDEVRIWNVERSGVEIQSAYNTGLTGSETGLVGYWRFSESSGTTAIDSSTQGYNGVLGNGVATDVPTRTLNYTTSEDNILAVAAPGVLTRATDPEGSPLAAVLVTGPAHAAAFTLDPDGSFSYTPNANFAGTDTFTYRANDGTADSNVATVTIDVTPVNDAPVLTATGTTLAYTENAAATVIDPGLTLSDADSLNLTSATVALSANYVNGQDVLAFTNQLGITGSWNAGTGTLTLTGTTTLANYEAALRTVTYVNTSDTPSTATRTVSFVANDGTANSVPATRNLSVAAVNDAPTGVPTISGTPTEDQTLSADASGISDADGLGTFSYQWLRNGASIAGATSASYTLGNADVGTQISVQVSYTDGHGTAEGPLPSASVGPVTNVNSPPTGVPTISGTPTEDQTLSADTSGISDADGLGTFSYQWLRNGASIAGATSGSYTLSDADVGTQISVRVAYTDAGGTAEGPLTSATVGPVTNVNDAPVGVPTLSGSASKGQTLSADASGISDADGLGTFSYQWLRNGASIAGATSASYTLGNADVGTQISVQVSYTDGHGTAEGPLPSASVGPVTNVNSPPTGVPTISGTPTEDQTLSADTSGISDADGLGTFSYQWLRNGASIAGATSGSYTLSDADVGTQISVRVAYTDAGGTAEGPLTSATVGPVTNVNDAPVGVPTLSGSASKGQTLSADASGISDADGLGTFSYQWLRNGASIAGATSASYTLGNADVGTQISVQVSYTDGHGTAEGPLPSATVGPVTNVNSPPTGVPTISGTPTEDQTLSADTSAISDADGLGTFSYQWLRNGASIAGATSGSYTLSDADVGTQISVRVAYTDAGGTTEGPLSAVAVGPVANVNDAPVGVPTLSGSASKGQTLSADASGISDADGLGTFSYQWLRNGASIAGATSASYTLGNADVGTQISVQVSYTDGHGTAEGPLPSASVGPVTNVNSPPTGVPTISGTPTEDQTLSADTSGISDADGLGTFSYQWLRNGASIAGATSGSYTLSDADVGTQISVRVAYTDAGGTAEGPLTSATVGPVTNVNDAPVGVPTLSGSASKGQTLSADASGISDADGLGTFSYQWLRNGASIAGATSASYTLGNADVGTQISVRVAYTDANGTAEGPLTSAPTAMVANVDTAAVIGGINTGSVTEDGALTAAGSLTVFDPDAGQARFITQFATAGTYGSFSIDATGTWSYSLNNAAAIVQQLAAGQMVRDNFTVASADGTTATVTLMITGTSDPASIGGTNGGVLSEDGILSASGNLTVTDVAGQASFQTQRNIVGTYGSFSIDATGAWTYNLNNAAAVVQQLAAGQTVTDSFTAASAGGITANVTVAISGTNDAPVMTDATITMRVGETVLLSPALIGAVDVDGPQDRLTFTTTEVVNGHFERVGDPGAPISTFSYVDLVAGRVRFVSSGTGAPAFRIAVNDGSLTSDSLNAHVVFDSGSATNSASAGLLAYSNISYGTGPDGSGSAVPVPTDVAPSAAAEKNPATQAKIAPNAVPGESQGAFLERLLSTGPEPAERQSRPTPAAPGDAVVTLADHSRSAVIDVINDITWDDFYLRLVSLTVVDPGSSGRDAKLAAGAVTDVSGEGSDGVSHELAVSAAQMTGIALTAGTVWWALRVGGLLTSLMASMPAWRHLDPLPILSDEEDEEVDWGDEDAEAARDEEAVDQVLDASGRGDKG